MRPRLLFGLPLALAMIASPVGEAQAGALAALKWKARPIVVLSDSRDDPRVLRQMAAFERSGPALAERDIKVLREAKPGSMLRKRLGVTARGFAVVLVGKDGDVKRVWREVVAPRDIFDLIDQMPMRREEMRG